MRALWRQSKRARARLPCGLEGQSPPNPKHPCDASASTTIHADLEVQFAGQTAKYKQVLFEQAKQGNETKISGIIPATLSDFKIDPPSLLTIAVKNEIPVRVDMTWRREK
jgi:hypothetical protein